MDYPAVSDIEKPIIVLYASGGLGLIILRPSGVVYTNQTGGYACLHPSAEGVYLPLVNELVDQEQALRDYFTGPKWQGCCNNGIDDDDADIIDAILQSSFDTRLLSVDRQQLERSHEAWVYVNIARPPDRYPKLPITTDAEAWADPESPARQMASLIFGFSSAKGILTWANSD